MAYQCACFCPFTTQLSSAHFLCHGPRPRHGMISYIRIDRSKNINRLLSSTGSCTNLSQCFLAYSFIYYLSLYANELQVTNECMRMILMCVLRQNNFSLVVLHFDSNISNLKNTKKNHTIHCPSMSVRASVNFELVLD